MGDHKPKLSVELDSISIDELKTLSKETLKLMPGELINWPCAGTTMRDCPHQKTTKVKDLGVHPWYYWHGRFVNIQRCGYACAHCWKTVQKRMRMHHHKPQRKDYEIKPTG